MTPDITYFLKVNGAIALFYLFYRLCFYRDTFFGLRRAMLLAFFGIAFLYPLLDVPDWMRGRMPMAETVSLYASVWLGPEAEQSAGHGDGGWLLPANWLIFVYVAGAVLGSVRFLVRLGSVAVLSARCGKAEIRGIRVRLQGRGGEPCSFFNLIFIDPAGYGEKELEEILTHELAHVRQLHSLDVLLCEWLAAVCWINPFVWLMRREVRRNLEYLADRSVLRAGYDSRTYQYHLLGSVGRPVATELSNRFHWLPLKNRIVMMNRRRTRAIGRVKYALLVPLTGVLTLLSNIDASARTGFRTAPEARPMWLPGETELAGAHRNRAYEPLSLLPARSPDSSRETDAVYMAVQEMPCFLADENLLKYLNERVRYPQAAAEDGIQGRVVCSVVIGRDGEVVQVELLQSVHPLLDNETLRVLKALPKWRPGKQNGVPVAVRITVPISFKFR